VLAKLHNIACDRKIPVSNTTRPCKMDSYRGRVPGRGGGDLVGRDWAEWRIPNKYFDPQETKLPTPVLRIYEVSVVPCPQLRPTIVACSLCNSRELAPAGRSGCDLCRAEVSGVHLARLRRPRKLQTRDLAYATSLRSSTNAARQPREGTRAVRAPFLTE
jgi:hypothetical protein